MLKKDRTAVAIFFSNLFILLIFSIFEGDADRSVPRTKET